MNFPARCLALFLPLAVGCSTLPPKKPAQDGVVVELAPTPSAAPGQALPVEALCSPQLVAGLSAGGLFSRVEAVQAEELLLEEHQISIARTGGVSVGEVELPAFFVEDAQGAYRDLQAPVELKATFAAHDATGRQIARWTCTQSAKVRVQSAAGVDRVRKALLEGAESGWSRALAAVVRGDSTFPEALAASAERLRSEEGADDRLAYLEERARKAQGAAESLRDQADALVDQARDREGDLGLQETLDSMNSSISTAGSSDPLLGFRKSMNTLQIRMNVQRIERDRDALLRKAEEKERLAQACERRAERARAMAERLRDRRVVALDR